MDNQAADLSDVPKTADADPDPDVLVSLTNDALLGSSADNPKQAVLQAREEPASGEKPLLLVKAFYFFSFCFLATYHRYLTLYFEEDHLSAEQIGWLWAVARLIGTASTPLVTALADHSKKARSMSQVSVVSSVALFLLLFVGRGWSQEFKLMLRAAAFWTHALVVSPRGALMDALARAACGQDTARWGSARVYGAVGWGALHLVLGPVIDALGTVMLAVSYCSFALVLIFVQQVSVPEECGPVGDGFSWKAVWGIFVRQRWFFLNLTAIGAGFSMVEGMLFLLLRELQASTLLCGLSVVVTVLFELPIFSYASQLLQLLGIRRMILLGQAAWVVRAVFYANIRVPWTVLLIEPLHGVTFALVWIAAIQHVADPRVSGHGLEASAQGLLAMCFSGLGPTLGLSFGGFLFEHAGSHAAYGVFAVFIAVCGVGYALFGDEPEELDAERVDCTAAAPYGKPAESCEDQSLDLNGVGG